MQEGETEEEEVKQVDGQGPWESAGPRWKRSKRGAGVWLEASKWSWLLSVAGFIDSSELKDRDRPTQLFTPMRHIVQVKLKTLYNSKQTFAHSGLHLPFQPHLHHFSLLCPLHPSPKPPVFLPLCPTKPFALHEVPVLWLSACGNPARLI